MKKLLTGLGAAVVLVLGVAAPAWAHVEPSVEEAPAGGEVTFGLIVPHGCEDGSGTTKVEVQMPDGVEEVTPEFVAGWEASVDDSDGLVVTWEGGPLPDGQFLSFGLSVAMPDTPGEVVEFPTVQTCEGGEEVSWTEGPEVEGEEEPEHPTPAITLTEATEEGHDHGGEAADDHADEHADEDAAADTHEESEDEGDSDTLAIVALVVGALGLLAGGYAVMSSRRAS